MVLKTKTDLTQIMKNIQGDRKRIERTVRLDMARVFGSNDLIKISEYIKRHKELHEYVESTFGTQQTKIPYEERTKILKENKQILFEALKIFYRSRNSSNYTF